MSDYELLSIILEIILIIVTILVAFIKTNLLTKVKNFCGRFYLIIKLIFLYHKKAGHSFRPDSFLIVFYW